MDEVQISIPTLNRLQSEPPAYLSAQVPASLLTSREQAQIRSAAAIRPPLGRPPPKGGETAGSTEAIPTSEGPTVLLTCIRPGRRLGKYARAGPVSLVEIGNGAVVIGGSLLYGRGTRISIVPSSGEGDEQAGCLPHSVGRGRLNGSIQGKMSKSKVPISRSSLVRQVRFSTCAYHMHKSPRYCRQMHPESDGS